MTSPIEIRKNSREVIRIGRGNYNGHDLVNLRVWFADEDGDFRPGRQGVAFKAALLPEVLAALGGLLATEETAT